MSTQFFRQVERQARRMGEVIDRLNVDKSKLACLDEGRGYVRARTTCLDCSNTAQCLAWLDADKTADGPPAFCPNFALFDSCKHG